MQLRKYQQDCLTAIDERRHIGIMRQLAVLFTGAGKSVIFSALPSMMPKGKQMYMFVHTQDLVQQGAEGIARWNPSLNIGIEMAEQHVDGREDVIVGSIQTLGKVNSPRLHKFDPNKAHWIVNDESHRSVATSYKRVNDYFLQGEDCCLVGFTATAQRADGAALGSVFDEIVYNFGMVEGIEAGWLTPVHGVQIRTGADLSVLSKADFDKQDVLSNAVNTPQRNETIVKAWLDYAWPRPTIAFTAGVQHAKDLAEAFKRQGVQAEAIWGSDPDRKEKQAKFRAGEIDLLANASLLIEGWDCWQVECIILAAPSKSQGRIIQEVGRGTRLHEGVSNFNDWLQQGLFKPEHKQSLLVMDCLDIFGRHSLVTLPSLFGLSPNLNLQGESVVAAVKAIQAALAKHPEADVSTLENLSDLETHIKQANLWQVRFAEEVKGFSELQWTKRGDGTYRILLPKNDYFRLEEDLVGKFSVDGSLKGKVFHQEKIAGLSEAVGLVEKTITSQAPEHLVLLGREQKWMKSPVSKDQMSILKKLRVPAEQIVLMNRWRAAAYITSKFNKRG